MGKVGRTIFMIRLLNGSSESTHLCQTFTFNFCVEFLLVLLAVLKLLSTNPSCLLLCFII